MTEELEEAQNAFAGVEFAVVLAPNEAARKERELVFVQMQMGSIVAIYSIARGRRRISGVSFRYLEKVHGGPCIVYCKFRRPGGFGRA